MATPPPNMPRMARGTTPPPAPKPVNYGRTGPGSTVHMLGEKMRQETAQALEQGLKHASFSTGLEALVSKTAGPLDAVKGFAGKAIGKAAPWVVGGGLAVGAGALGHMAYNNAKQDELQRHNPLVYSPMTGVG